MNQQEFCGKHDIVIRIADWTRDHDSLAVDVEVYIKGQLVAAPLSHSFCTRFVGRSRKEAKALALAHIITVLNSKEVTSL